MVACKSTAEEVLFERSHHRISSIDRNVRTTLHILMFFGVKWPLDNAVISEISSKGVVTERFCKSKDCSMIKYNVMTLSEVSKEELLDSIASTPII